MTKKEPYQGIPRVTTIVSKIYPGPEPGWLDKCGESEFRHVSPPTEQQILDWSSEFGTKMHKMLLEDYEKEVGTHEKNEMDLILPCVQIFNRFKEKYSPRTVSAEEIVCYKDEFENPIYAGTCDWVVRIKGELWIIDLKFWGCWRHYFGYKLPKKEVNSEKSAKTNLQTGLYEKTFEGTYRRAVLWITPDFYMFKEFKQDSRHMAKALEIAAELSGADKLNF